MAVEGGKGYDAFENSNSICSHRGERERKARKKGRHW